MMKRISSWIPHVIIIWHHLMNFCSVSLIVIAVAGILRQSMPLAQSLVYILMGGLNLAMSYYKGYLKF